MKTTITLIVAAVILFFVTGCGPGHPFELESLHTPQHAAATHIVAAG